MSGKMRKRAPTATRDTLTRDKALKGFHAPQKDNSKRAKRKAGLNNYNDQKKNREDQNDAG